MIQSRKEQIHRDQQLAKQNESYVRAPLPHEQELWVVDTNEELVMNTPYGSTAIGGVYRKPVTPREARIGNSVSVNWFCIPMKLTKVTFAEPSYVSEQFPKSR